MRKYGIRQIPSLINRYVLRRDNNVFISPVQLRHIKRYSFAAHFLVGKRVLDVACGAGYGSNLLGENVEYTGVDYAGECISYAKRHYGGNFRHFLKLSIFELPSKFTHDSFDTIVSFETLEHVKWPDRMLRILMDLLGNNGRLIISIPLNHPDMIYHRRQYTYDDVKEMFGLLAKKYSFDMQEFLQSHLDISSNESLLRQNSILHKGTWIGILTKR